MEPDRPPLRLQRSQINCQEFFRRLFPKDYAEWIVDLAAPRLTGWVKPAAKSAECGLDRL